MVLWNFLILIYYVGFVFGNIDVDESLPTKSNFVQWMLEHDKRYSDQEEFYHKYQTFVKNHILVEKLNQVYEGQTEFKLNHFADLSPQEFRDKVLIKNLQKPFEKDVNKYLPLTNVDDLPESFDWREKDAVTPVKDQGMVGTCWAFSAVQNLESAYRLKGNKLTSLSVEQIVDCDGFSTGDNEHADCGVYGGWPYLAFEYVKKAGGIESEDDYSYCAGVKKPCLPCSPPGYNRTECGPPVPYCLLSQSCQAKVDSEKFVPNLKVVDWKRIDQNETEIAAQLMNYGPLSVALNAELLQFYFGGVFDPFLCNPKALNHAVLLVGWGVRESRIFGTKPYWIVKNSWGSKWGENGYFRILRGKGKCGIHSEVEIGRAHV